MNVLRDRFADLTAVYYTFASREMLLGGSENAELVLREADFAAMCSQEPVSFLDRAVVHRAFSAGHAARKLEQPIPAAADEQVKLPVDAKREQTLSRAKFVGAVVRLAILSDMDASSALDKFASIEVPGRLLSSFDSISPAAYVLKRNWPVVKRTFNMRCGDASGNGRWSASLWLGFLIDHLILEQAGAPEVALEVPGMPLVVLDRSTAVQVFVEAIGPAEAPEMDLSGFARGLLLLCSLALGGYGEDVRIEMAIAAARMILGRVSQFSPAPPVVS